MSKDDKPSLVDYWSGDNTREGYNQGFQDGEQGKTANPAGYSHIRKFNFLWAFNHAAETYSQGYRTGFPDAIRKKNGLYTSNDGKAPSMTVSDDSYGRHSIQLLDNLASQLAALEDKANTARENYQRQLNAAAASGFMTDYTNVLGGDKFNTFSRNIDGLLEIVEISRREMMEHKKIIEQLADDARNRAQQA